MIKINITEVYPAKLQLHYPESVTSINRLMEVFMTQISDPPVQHQSTDPKGVQSHKTLAGIIYLASCAGICNRRITLIIALAINYAKRDEVKGTWCESHFDWQTKTALIALSVSILGIVTIQIGIGFFFVVGAMLWLVYRIVFGWLRLYEKQTGERRGFLDGF